MNPALELDRALLPPAKMPSTAPGQLHQALEQAPNSSSAANNLTFALSASLWFACVDEFHHYEDEALADGTYESILDEHRFVLSALIKDGEHLVLAAKQNRIEPEARFTLKDLEATVESLHVAFHAQHRNGNSRAEKVQINKLFDVQRPGN